MTLIGGSRTADLDVLDLAEQFGAGVAKAGYNLICGGGPGTMEAACRGFVKAEGPGRTIGILPLGHHDWANPYVDIPIPTGIGYARNALVVQGGQAVVAIGGESGTLSELALAWQFGKPIAVLSRAGGLAETWAGRAMDQHRGDHIVACMDVPSVLVWLETVL